MHTPTLFTTLFLALSLAHPLSRRANSDLAGILAALKANSPDDAAAAASSLSKRDELSDILAALAENSPDDAAAAKSAKSKPAAAIKRDEVADIIAALAANSPSDAAAAKGQEAA